MLTRLSRLHFGNAEPRVDRRVIFKEATAHSPPFRVWGVDAGLRPGIVAIYHMPSRCRLVMAVAYRKRGGNKDAEAYYRRSLDGSFCHRAMRANSTCQVNGEVRATAVSARLPAQSCVESAFVQHIAYRSGPPASAAGISFSMRRSGAPTRNQGLSHRPANRADPLYKLFE